MIKQTSRKIDQPEFLLLLVVTLMLWSVGMVDMLSQADFSQGSRLYNDNWSGLLLTLNSLLLLPWLGALFIPKSHQYLSQLLSWVQRNNWLSLLTMLLICGLLINLFVWPFWFRFSGFSTIYLIGLILFTLIFLFVRPKPTGKRLWWRRVSLSLLGVVLGFELVAQGLAYFGALPGDVHWDGGYVKHGRIYHNPEGLGNGRANSDGWYANEFELAEDSTRIAVVGDTFIQALQVDLDDHLAVKLQENINMNSQDETSVEVLPLGHTGLGPSVYLHPELLGKPAEAYGVNEFIVYIHLSNDMRNIPDPAEPDMPYTFDEEGKAVIHPDSFDGWHDAAHYVLNVHSPMHPIRIIDSHLMSRHLLRSVARQLNLISDETFTQADQDSNTIPTVRGLIGQGHQPQAGEHNPVRIMRLVDTTGYSDFLFDITGNAQSDEAHVLTESFIEVGHESVKENDITFRIVTIPAFPQTFYETFSDSAWEPTFANYDLLLPERRLQQFAEENDIPFLAMGAYMAENVATADEISQFFFNGNGHFTPEGHAFFAQATYDCFYAPLTTPVGGCFSSYEIETE